MGYCLTHLDLHVITKLILWAVVVATLRQPRLKNQFSLKLT
ncbi:hypothetical protein Poly59_25560 [Rubripirellula reticaptiva]|uniref:Uncharacterized protein n=1 Tax=Rubripirellula reticaptiva TaxID=2528013 RepID=A0A5C6F5H7_9BACT|nr:hypothetical protein Poly59_25560 [Rubripirellula reticaptiva]